MKSKQARFIAEYLKDGNGTRAATAAGYAKGSAHVAATRLLKNAKIAEAIQKAQARVIEKAEEKAVLSKQWVMERLEANYWAAFKGQPVLDRYGNATGAYIQKIGDANRAVELIGKELGMFVDVKINTTPDAWADIVKGVHGSQRRAEDGDNPKLH